MDELKVCEGFKSPGIKDRFRMLIIKILSLKFMVFVVQVIIGTIWFKAMLDSKTWDVGLWGVWSGYMVGAFTVYTAGNVQTKKVSGTISVIKAEQ